ncbi:immunoglobulin superfamily member 10-like isoform X6 [Tachysurus fulvidraco]|uniref:immunoglobulin superfamily member 10-like isoform X6 n=1 Tax=Tachysurus fulvidraco TaxID=1234273 RepID=UPI001FEF6B45|nr:immunoglobulin superfamily member 10-like isoform X6 [Tachysurus fulvidraco]
MLVCFYLLLFLHITEGCSLKGNKETEEITAYTGDSVLLPCSCTELHSKPETFTWKKYTDGNKWTQISPESDEYKERFQLVNDHSSGNLSLLISHLTVQDGGDYMCDVNEGEYRYIRLTVKGCSLKGNGGTEEITAYTGDSVLLPCSCTELHSKPETFTWKRNTDGNNWAQISPESDEYKERFQLVNDHSSGNLSLLISHLTVQDGGLYRCDVKGDEYRYIRLTVKIHSPGCRPNQQTVNVTGIVGQSVLLPCSCSELQAKPHTFIWRFYKGSDVIKIFPKQQTNLYTDRVQVFNVHPPGNLSLLISHLTVEDGGWYRCEINNKSGTDIKLTVKGAPTRPSSSTPVITTTSPHSRPGTNSVPLSTTIIIFTAVGVLLLLLILGGVIYWKHRVQRRRQIDDGQAGQQKKQNDSDVLYTAMDPKTEHNKEEQDGLLYATVVHSNTVRAAHTPVASEEVTVYASIKTN